MGFAKAYGLANLPQLTQPISKPLGAAWLLAALLMMEGGVLVHGRSIVFLGVAVAAVVVSQIVIATSWRDAWAGTIANLILAGAIIYLRRG